MVEDAFVQEIDQEIKSIKAQEQERVSCMTYAMEIQEEQQTVISKSLAPYLRLIELKSSPKTPTLTRLYLGGI